MGKTINMLAFDLGASSGRAILGKFDGEKINFEEIHRFPNEPVWVNNHLYWDVLRLWHEIKIGIRKAVGQGIEISSIGVDTWGVDYGLIDEKGQLLANPHHYRDQRTVPMKESLLKDLGVEYLYSRTGIQIVSFNTLFQITADLRNNPKLMLQTAKILLMPDLLNYLLTGVQAAEYSIASTTQMMDIHTKKWNSDILQHIGLASNKLPEIVQAGTHLGVLTNELCQELGCKPIPVIAVTGHDTAAAIAATPMTGLNAGYLSSGTWSLFGVERAEPIVTPLACQYEFTNEGGLNSSVLLLKNIIGLWLIQECRRIWRNANPELNFANISQMAAQSRPFGSLINVNDQRFFAPVDMAFEIKGYCRDTKQAIPETIGDIARCVYESLALEYRAGSEKLKSLTGNSLKILHIVSGGSQDVVLSQLIADALQIPVIAGPVEATALGNLTVQAMSFGTIGNIKESREVIKRSSVVKEYQPESSGGWDEAYQRYQKLSNR
jgi:rhamnulokinase